jgi:hypothetical protein
VIALTTIASRAIPLPMRVSRGNTLAGRFCRENIVS